MSFSRRMTIQQLRLKIFEMAQEYLPELKNINEFDKSHEYLQKAAIDNIVADNPTDAQLRLAELSMLESNLQLLEQHLDEKNADEKFRELLQEAKELDIQKTDAPFKLGEINESYFYPKEVQSLERSRDSQYLTFLNLAKLPSLLKTCKYIDGFYYFTFPMSEAVHLRADHAWKIHISIHPDDAGRAFDLIAPILYQFFHTFKFVDIIDIDKIRKKESQELNKETLRYTDGRQFTIYLLEKEDGTPYYGLAELQNVIRKINFILSSNQVRPGLIPESDAPIDQYVSLRNDRDHLGLYLSAEFVGRNFNPINRQPNPYSSMLNIKTEPFSPAKHFEKLPHDTDKDRAEYYTPFYLLHESLLLTLYATVFEYVKIDKMEEEFENFLDSLRKFTFPNLYFKKVYQNNQDIIVKVLLIMQLVEYVDDQRMNKLARVDNLSKLHFHNLISNSNKSQSDYYFNGCFKAPLNSVRFKHQDLNQLLDLCETERKRVISEIKDENLFDTSDSFLYSIAKLFDKKLQWMSLESFQNMDEKILFSFSVYLNFIHLVTDQFEVSERENVVLQAIEELQFTRTPKNDHEEEKFYLTLEKEGYLSATLGLGRFYRKDKQLQKAKECFEKCMIPMDSKIASLAKDELSRFSTQPPSPNLFRKNQTDEDSDLDSDDDSPRNAPRRHT